MSLREGHFQKLVELVKLLRGPDGCPWDREQTRETLKPMLIEETYEVLDALEDGEAEELCDELGDLLFQILFHSRIAEEKEEFNIHDVCYKSYKKMVERHPHVFGSESYADSKELLKNWEDIKNEQRKAEGRSVKKESLLDGIPRRLPALYEAYQISSKAARIGFDWDNIESLRDQFLEEFEELQNALEEGNKEKIKSEVGDLLFSALNISRRLGIDPETALKGANRKFTRRFKSMESYFIDRGKVLKETDFQEMERIWQNQKVSEPD